MAQEVTLIRNANIFDGTSETLQKGQSVLVEGNLIKKIGIGLKAPKGAKIIDAQGATLTPGFIDAHAHLMFQMSIPETLNADPFYFGYVATQTAKTYLMHGFTTVRDASGNSFSLKKAIDRGIVEGPRVFPSGPMISQTSGHSDHRTDAQVSAMISYEPSTLMKYDMVQLADGVPEVLKATREALRRGASQIKISVGGGTGSFADPLDVTQYTDQEIQAAVQAAADWGTYVMSHVYNDKGAQRAIKNGVRSIEHGNLLSEETFRLMMEHDVWLSPQVLVYTYHPAGYTDDQKNKHDEAFDGIDGMFKAAKKLNFQNIAFGTDVITDPEKLKEINNEFALRTQWFEPIDILRQATSNSARLLALSGPRNPYGKIGLIQEGAMADILLINGNPLQDIKILTKPQENLLLIMKDGKVYKNIL
ncbi:imidazolonepropionase [Sediminicola luteus]|uniref:Imidazolonepropionase n=2 Tax=Sediminicola luteus TaxID=319238 RepID=A0A2A4GFN1_9FLAO|nr:imidazolonepropionase [Sediminicola luteus]